MNRVARDGGYTVLATGHNLDDEAAVLFGNTLNWQTSYLQRQSPVLAAREGLVRKVKPLCRFYEREMAAYALVEGIEYIYDECPYAVGAKSILYTGLTRAKYALGCGPGRTVYLPKLWAANEL